MLSAEKNQTLTQVSAGTPMGEYLRRYWHPIAGASEFDNQPIKAVRLLGEDLTLYKDLNGVYGLVDRHCAHRRADLSYGFVEQSGIRCNYHGWRYDEKGACVEQPYEDTVRPDLKATRRCSIKAYQVKECAGLLFAYMGPQPAPELPIWEPFTWQNGFREVVVSEVPCNWFQCQENSCDPVHFEWMHDNWSKRLQGKSDYAPKHLAVKFEEFEHGFVYKRIREGGSEKDPYWTTGRVALWPNAFYLGGHFEWRVPIDDENTLSIAWFFMRVPKGREPYVQQSVPTWFSPIRDESGRWITSHVMNQDFVAWIGQGRIADRTRETLASSDGGIVLIRKRFLDDIEAMQRGEDVKGTLRSADAASLVELPYFQKHIMRDGLALEDYRKFPLLEQRLSGFVHLKGQPQAVRAAYVEAFGLRGTRYEPDVTVVE